MVTSANAKDTAYFEKRSLKKGSAGWLLLTGLGVAYTISGDFSGWNYGISKGGWMGLVIAWLTMGIMYMCTVFGLAELSSAIPTAGGGYGFARSAMGRTGGFATGLALIIEYVCAPAAISTFIANYIQTLGILPNAPTILLVILTYIVFTAIHIAGVGEALRFTFAVTLIALLSLLAFTVTAAPHFQLSNLFNMQPTTNDRSLFLPAGWNGVLACLPYGIWFFLGVEGVPLAAEECTDPKKDMPRGLIGAMAILSATGFLSLLLVSGVMGAKAAGISDAPLIDALTAIGSPGMALFLNIAGLLGLIASFFSLMYAGSRQIFALSRAGYLPTPLSLTGSRKTPYTALLTLSAIGIGIVYVMQDGSLILNIAVFGACASYVLMNLSHILLRVQSPLMHRGYEAPGGIYTSSIGLALSLVAIISTFFVDVKAACCVLVIYIIGIVYFMFWAKARLVSNAPEEEFAAILIAESELE